MRILVLEDSDDRIHAMRDIVLDRFGAFDIRFFKSCRAMQEAIDAEGLADVALISLDHDLEMLPGPEGRMIDPGTGVDMAEWLATQQPKCPVIVQTTNTTGGREMVRLLRQARWHVDRVVPHDGEAWILSTWYPLVRTAVLEAVSPNRLPSTGLSWLSAIISKRVETSDAIRRSLGEFNIQLKLAAGHPGVAIELLTLRGDRWCESWEPGLVMDSFQQFVGPAGVAFEELSPIAGTGPISTHDQKLSPEVSVALVQSGIHEILPLVLRVDTPKVFESLIVVSSRSKLVKLNDPRIHAVVMDLLECLKILISLSDIMVSKDEPHLRSTAAK